MNQQKTGALIRKLRLERKMTQLQLAEQLFISDKTVSKWERGLGLPDVALLPQLSQVLGVSVESLLSGQHAPQEEPGGSMKKTVFYCCKQCGNVMAGTGEAAVSCCGRKLTPDPVQKAEGIHQIQIEPVEDEWYLTSEHPMEKEHFLSFAAFVTGDRLILLKQYPEWGLHARLPKMGHGVLYTYCTQHGLFRQAL